MTKDGEPPAIQTLILGCGTYEGGRVPEILVGGQFQDGFDTVRGALGHFRRCMTLLVEDKIQKDESGTCSYCSKKHATPLDRYCSFCGRRLRREHDMYEDTSALFQEFFERELHEFTEWEALANFGWNVNWISKGRYVRVDGFDQMLANWEGGGIDDDEDIDVDEWWKEQDQYISTGEISPDENEEG